MKDVIDSKNDQQLLESLLAETAKAANELKCAESDIAKARNRLRFNMVVLHKLIDRQGDQNETK